MKRTLSLAVALLMAGGLSAPAFAQAQPEVTIVGEMSNQDLNLAELQAFGGLAAAHKKMARRLAANPRLADNHSFLKKYPDLNNFFTKYPGSKERLMADPGNYLTGVHMHHRRVAKAAAHKKKVKTKAPAAKSMPAAPAASAAPAPEAPAAPSNP